MPLPNVRLPLSEPPVLMVPLSLPAPRSTDSTPLKLKPSIVPAFAPVTIRASAALVEVMLSPVPEPPPIASRPVKLSVALFTTLPLAVPELMPLSVIAWAALSAL